MAQNALKPWEQLTITDNYLFQLVMHRKHLCKQLIKKILQIKIRDIAYPDYEKTLLADPLKKSIRLDVYVEDVEGRVYDIEMQCTNPGEEELGTRARYYQSIIDSELLEKGASYKELNTSYVILICTFDPFNRGRALYKFRNTCEDEGDAIELKNREYKLFLNSKGYSEAKEPDLADFLQYIDGKSAEREFAREVADAVRELQRSPTERRDYMLLSQILKEEQKASFEQGVRHTALAMLKNGISIDMIQQCTGLSKEELNVLQTAGPIEEK